MISRRDFLKYCTITAGALGLNASGLIKLQNVLAAESGPPVVWLQGQGCTGCSVSLLNSIYYMTIDQLLLNTIDLEFHATVMAGAGDLAVSAAEEAYANEGYVLVVEGAIPKAEGGGYCYLWPGMTALNAVETFSEKAALILAVGTCAAYGGLIAGAPNPTGAVGVWEVVSQKQVINIPGCPAHPDWIVGTIAHLLAYGKIPELDQYGRPIDFYQRTVHSQCPNKQNFHDQAIFAQKLSNQGCLSKLGCKGRWTGADCPIRKWNSSAAGEFGDNWCIGGRSPCQGCTEPGFPDSLSPWYTLEHP
jgi:hydrogenase small subunit